MRLARGFFLPESQGIEEVLARLFMLAFVIIDNRQVRSHLDQIGPCRFPRFGQGGFRWLERRKGLLDIAKMEIGLTNQMVHTPDRSRIGAVRCQRFLEQQLATRQRRRRIDRSIGLFFRIDPLGKRADSGRC